MKVFFMVGTIIILVLLLVLAGIIYYAYQRTRETVSTYSQLLFGTSDIKEGIKKRDREVAARQKTVASATKLYLPKIMDDFPEFHLDEMKTRAENVLTSYLEAIDLQKVSHLAEGTNELKDKLLLHIESLRREEKKEHFSAIKIHRTEISQYRKEKGRCSVVFQSAAQHIHYVEKGDKVLKGRKDLLEQAKYNVEVVYVQDQDQVENLGDAGRALNCPNCGAPITSLGAKTCAYCDSPIVEFNIRVWNFSSVEEV